MNGPPYMPLWVYDIESDEYCRQMADADFGRYMRLLIRQWVEGDVPAEAALAVRVAVLDADSVGATQRILDQKFSLNDASRRRNPKCAELREKAIRKIETNRENASKSRKKGGYKKRSKRKAIAIANGIAKPSVSVSVSKSEFSLTGSVLDTTEGQRAWSDWEQHRKEIKHPLTPLARTKALNQMNDIGHDRAVAMIDHSIAQGWRGLYEPDGSSNGKASRRPMT